MIRAGLLRRFGAFGASLAVSLVVAELVVERWMPVGIPIYRADPELLHDARPDTRRIQPMLPSTVREGDAARVLVETNSLGFRGPELDVPKRRPRLLVLGDSFVIAENVPLASTFVKRLELELTAQWVAASARDAGPDESALHPSTKPLGVECVNAGRSGYGPDQDVLLGERCIEVVDPDAVLLVLCSANDLGDLARNKLFRIGSEGELERLRPRLAPRIEAEFAARDAAARSPALVRLWRFRGQRRDLEARLAQEGREPLAAIEAHLRAQHDDFFVAHSRTVDTLFEDVFDVVPALDPEGRIAREQTQLLTAVLRRLVALTRVRGIPCAVLVTPAGPDLVPGLAVDLTPETHPGYVRGTLSRLHQDAAVAAGLRVVDVTPAFEAHPDPSVLFVGGFDLHWNAAGQALAAREAARVLAGWPEWAEATRRAGR